MKKYLYDYIEKIDQIINNNQVKNIEDIKKEHLHKIEFFQHERLVHLIVTLFYVIFMIIFFAVSTVFIGFLFIAFILMIFVLCYIVHYFRLENGVQYLYVQYDKLNDLSKKPVKNDFLLTLTSKFIDNLIDRI